MIEAPQSFIVRQECEKAASQHGFRRSLGEMRGWAAFGSTTVDGLIYLAAQGPRGPWYLALDHAGVVAELEALCVNVPGPGLARYEFETLGHLYSVLARVYQLATSLPDAPLREFEQRTAGLPRETETERWRVERIGQDIFRDRLMGYWQGRCPLTGISDPALLRASHIIPWSECESDSERLDVYNGLLLSALWDAAFDRALVTFDDDGNPLFSNLLSERARAELRWMKPLELSGRHQSYLTRHRGAFNANGGSYRSPSTSEKLSEIELSWLARRRISGLDDDCEYDDVLLFPYWIFERVMQEFPHELDAVLQSHRIRFELNGAVLSPQEALANWKNRTSL